MFPPEFDYYRANGVEEAFDLLENHADADPVVLAGGHGLLPDLKTGAAAPGVAIDIGDIDGLRGIDAAPDGGLRVGALTTHAALASSDAAATHAPVLAEAAGEVGDVQVRNRGTVGGNLAEADPSADLPAAAVAADATLVVRGRDGEREIPADEFFAGDGDTALGDRELLTEIRVSGAENPDDDGRTGGAYAKKTHPATGYALVGVAASLAVRDGTVTDPRLAASGVADAPVRLTAVEDAIAGTAEGELVGEDADSDALAAAAERAGETLDPADARSDVAASGEFRLHLLGSYAERALAAAFDRATDRRAPRPAGCADSEVTCDE
ncbi:FAD binding domain-containing protein [Halorussus aquaticus]|uniref:FAD binding domain-containing protein n=1 Tax=Halorussus aquaticus TaxID=2953748 RepID=A0ABD5PVX0_9EURY|nr:FAD binding domain-containing protein [Halorussus aquaticus]